MPQSGSGRNHRIALPGRWQVGQRSDPRCERKACFGKAGAAALATAAGGAGGSALLGANSSLTATIISVIHTAATISATDHAASAVLTSAVSTAAGAAATVSATAALAVGAADAACSAAWHRGAYVRGARVSEDSARVQSRSLARAASDASTD